MRDKENRFENYVQNVYPVRVKELADKLAPLTIRFLLSTPDTDKEQQAAVLKEWMKKVRVFAEETTNHVKYYIGKYLAKGEA